MRNKPKEPEKKKRLKPVLLYPLEVEEALGDIMSIKPMGETQPKKDDDKT